MDNKDYSKLTLEELIVEEKKIKRNQIISAIIIGFLIGVIVYGIAKNGFGFLYIFIPLFLIYGIYKNSQRLQHNSKQIQVEIGSKKIK